MAWNLVDAVNRPGDPRRHYYLPLASIPPGRAAVRPVDRTVFNINEDYVPSPDGLTADVVLTIQIRPPAGGFTSEDGLPDPAMRLHAIGVAWITFRPADGTMGDRLVLKMPGFSLPLHTETFGPVKWWPRWVEAGCIPHTVIYENIDRAQLEMVLNAVAVRATSDFPPGNPEAFGLSFPPEVTQSNKANFIARFLSGDQSYFIDARSGAYIGTAAQDPNNPANRLLKLHVQYHDHTDANPHPMNPRELFHLLFGDDSQEALNHPLLRRIDEIGNGQNGVNPESKRMLLRPPLRTWKRVVWEADQEIMHHQPNWAPAGALGQDRLYNTHRRENRQFSRGPYGPRPPDVRELNKCNVFVSDICLRAGFCVCIHPLDDHPVWHYIDANSYANNARAGGVMNDREPLMGFRRPERNRFNANQPFEDDSHHQWGWKLEGLLRNQAARDETQLQQILNNLMQEEGRCIILAGARARKFIKHRLDNGSMGIANCSTSIRPRAIGHIVIVKTILDPPPDAPSRNWRSRANPILAGGGDQGVNRIRIETMEASDQGAVSRQIIFQTGGRTGNAASAQGFICGRLHLIELHPGKDPDTLQGLRDLNAHGNNIQILRLAEFAAPNTEATHFQDGRVRPAPHPCCHDQWPNGDPIEVPGPCADPTCQ